MIVLMDINLWEHVGVYVVGNDCMCVCVCVNKTKVQIHSGGLVCSGFKFEINSKRSRIISK